jgi:hypothetical protein
MSQEEGQVIEDPTPVQEAVAAINNRVRQIRTRFFASIVFLLRSQTAEPTLLMRCPLFFLIFAVDQT